jgi:hypothetical protein
MFCCATACCCLLFPASGQQDVEVKPGYDLKVSSEIAMPDASDDLRWSLRKAQELKFGECLPDSRFYPELFRKEIEALRVNPMQVGVIAGYSIYDLDPAWGANIPEGLRDGLIDAESIVPLSDELAALQFVPENFLSWKSNAGIHHVLISLRQKQILFVHDEMKLRYTLTHDGCNRLRIACWHRTSRPDDLKDAKLFLDVLASDRPIAIHEGTPRPGHYQDPQTEKTRGVVSFGLFKFFKTGVAERDLSSLRSLLAKEGTITEWGGGKACGGFHPDFCVTWLEGRDRVVVHICLTCHEVRIEKGAASFLYDLGKESYDELKEELERFRKVGN